MNRGFGPGFHATNAINSPHSVEKTAAACWQILVSKVGRKGREAVNVFEFRRVSDSVLSQQSKDLTYLVNLCKTDAVECKNGL